MHSLSIDFVMSTNIVGTVIPLVCQSAFQESWTPDVMISTSTRILYSQHDKKSLLGAAYTM